MRRRGICKRPLDTAPELEDCGGNTQTVGSRLDLYCLSAITQNSTVIVESSKAIAPLDWDTVQRNVLMENYNPASNSGYFSFDWSAYNDPHRRY